MTKLYSKKRGVAYIVRPGDVVSRWGEERTEIRVGQLTADPDDRFPAFDVIHDLGSALDGRFSEDPDLVEAVTAEVLDQLVSLLGHPTVLLDGLVLCAEKKLVDRLTGGH